MKLKNIHQDQELTSEGTTEGSSIVQKKCSREARRALTLPIPEA